MAKSSSKEPFVDKQRLLELLKNEYGMNLLQLSKMLRFNNTNTLLTRLHGSVDWQAQELVLLNKVLDGRLYLVVHSDYSDMFKEVS